MSKQKAKARRRKKVARKQKEIAKGKETKPSVSAGQAGVAKPGDLIGTTAG